MKELAIMLPKVLEEQVVEIAVAEVTKRLVKEAFELLSKRKTQEDE